MKCIINNEENPSFNLAFEEEFLLSEYMSGEPVFCIWRNPKSVIIGVSQIAEQEVNLRYCIEKGIPVIKRRTGGGAVYHDLGNLNFTFFFPYRPSQNLYQLAYAILKPAFQELGIEISLSQTNDLLIDRKKFSGMAERIVGEKAMVHGTLLYDTDFNAMSNALSNVKGKFTQPRGVASRHASVVNLKEHLKDIPDVLSLSEHLRMFFTGHDSKRLEHPSDDFLDRVRQRAERHYLPLNINDIIAYNGNIQGIPH